MTMGEPATFELLIRRGESKAGREVVLIAGSPMFIFGETGEKK